MPASTSKTRTPHDSAIAGFAHGQVPAPLRAEQLLDVAEELFGRGGYGSTSIEGIARAAGVTRPVIYEHFGSKEGIYLACLRRARAQLEGMLADAGATASDLRGRLEAGADAYFRFVAEDPARWRVLSGAGVEVPEQVAAEATRLHLGTEQRFAEMFAVAAPHADELALLAFAHALGGAARQLAQWWLRTPGVTREQVVKWYVAICWDGLRGLGAA